MTPTPSSPGGPHAAIDRAGALPLASRAETMPAGDPRRTAASVAMLERLSEHWSLRGDERETLLGGVPKSTWSEWRQRPALARIKADTRERIANLFTIDLNAHALFAPEFADRWVREPNAAFAGESPMSADESPNGGVRLGHDCYRRGHYDRYYVRLQEIRQSLRILGRAIAEIPGGPILAGKKSHQVKVPAGEAYSRVENPKGELGFYVVSDGSATAYRYHVRSPSFINLTALEPMCLGHTIADVVGILGSLDIVLGEVDR